MRLILGAIVLPALLGLSAPSAQPALKLIATIPMPSVAGASTISGSMRHGSDCS
jgi:hypothetical protein